MTDHEARMEERRFQRDEDLRLRRREDQRHAVGVALDTIRLCHADETLVAAAKNVLLQYLHGTAPKSS